MKEVYISYSRPKKNSSKKYKELIYKIVKVLNQNGFLIQKDDLSIPYKGDIDEFMKDLGRSSFCILILNEDYFYSKFCMYEAYLLSKRNDFRSVVFPVLIAEEYVLNPRRMIEVKQFWKKEIAEYEQSVLRLGTLRKMDSFLNELNRLEDIYRNIDNFFNEIKSLNLLSIEDHFESEFKDLIDQINNRGKIPTIHNRFFPNTNIDSKILDQNLYGRKIEIEFLLDALRSKKSKSILIKGFPGIGKTALTLKLISAIKDDFNYIHYYSFINPITFEDYCKTIFVLCEKDSIEFQTFVDKENLAYVLIELIISSNVLLVLDNFDSILTSFDSKVNYQKEESRNFIKFIEILLMETDITSSRILINSRETIHPLKTKECYKHVVELELKGVTLDAYNKILLDYSYDVKYDIIKKLYERYSGNPFALKIAISIVKELYNGNFNNFIVDNNFIFDEIHRMLETLFSRLDQVEKHIISYLTIRRGGDSLSSIVDVLSVAFDLNKRDIVNAIISLKQKFVLDLNYNSKFKLNNIVLEFHIPVFISEFVDRFINKNPDGSMALPLNPSNASSISQNYYITHIIFPLIEKLLTKNTRGKIENLFSCYFYEIRKGYIRSRYLAGNLLSLMTIFYDEHIIGQDFSSIEFVNADFSRGIFEKCNFDNSSFIDCSFANNFSSVTCLAISEDQSFFALGDVDCSVRIFSSEAIEPLVHLFGHKSWIRSVCFYGNDILASTGDDGIIKVWHAKTGNLIKDIPAFQKQVWCLRFSQAKLLFSAGNNGEIRVWNIVNGECMHVFNQHNTSTWFLDINDYNSSVLSSDGNGTIFHWNFDDLRVLNKFNVEGQNVWQVRFSPWNKEEFYYVVGNNIYCRNLFSGELVSIGEGHDKEIRCFAFYKDKNQIITGGEDCKIKVWDSYFLDSPKTLIGHTSAVRDIIVSTNKRMFISGGYDQQFKVWSLEGLDEQLFIKGYSSKIWDMDFFPNNQIVTAHEDQSIGILTYKSGLISSYKQFPAHSYSVRAVSCSHVDSIFASGGHDKQIKIWSKSGELIQTLSGHSRAIETLRFYHNQSKLVSGADDNLIKIWDINSVECLKELVGHRNWVRKVTLSKDDELLFSSSEDGEIRIWSLIDYSCLHSLNIHDSRVRALDYSDEKKLLISGDDNGLVNIWSMTRCETVKKIVAHSDRIRTLAISPNAHTFVTSGSDARILIWRLEDFQLLGEVTGNEGWVTCVKYINPTKLVVVSHDETIRVVDVYKKTSMELFRLNKPYMKSSFLNVKGLSPSDIVNLKALGGIIYD